MAKIHKLFEAHLSATHDFHKSMMARHEEGSPEHAAHQTAMEACVHGIKEIGKAEIADSLEKRVQQLEPMGVSAVAPPNPSLRAVPRFGAPAYAEKVDVPLEFEHLFKVDEVM